MSKEENILTKAIKKKITRRSFVKWSAAIGATASMSGLIARAGHLGDPAQMGDPSLGPPSKPVTTENVVDWRPNCCLVCHSWCAIAVGVDVWGHVRKIEGQGGQPKNYEGTTVPLKPWAPDPTSSHPPTVNTGYQGVTGYGTTTVDCQAKYDDANHIPTKEGYLPFACHNKGRICAKGGDGMEHLYNPDRVKYPLERVGDRGSGQWRRVSWEYALRKMANVLRELAGCTTFYDLNVVDPTQASFYTLNSYPPTSGQQYGLTEAPREKDYRHRVVMYVGRNESGMAPQFMKAYGSPNHVEHTSLCELSRHVAGTTMWGHHWSSPDLQSHTDGAAIRLPFLPTQVQWGGNGAYTLHDDNDVDLYVEWGGNPCEQKIPHASYGNHLGDRRRKNLQGYTYNYESGARPITDNRKGRIICIEVRQSNTAAWADEQVLINPGSDGALALGMIFYLMRVDPGSLTLRQELDRGHLGNNGGIAIGDDGADPSTRHYYGLFESEEDPISAGGAASAVPTGKSLEAYLRNTGSEGFRAHLGLSSGATDQQVIQKVADIAGVSLGTVCYLARAIGGLNVGTSSAYWDSSGNYPFTSPSGTLQYANAVVDGYRGPAKHSNGTYNYRAIRSLQILAANQSACHFWGNRGAAKQARGGFNCPGGFISDKNWIPYGFNKDGTTHTGEADSAGATAPHGHRGSSGGEGGFGNNGNGLVGTSAVSNISSALPPSQDTHGQSAAISDRQRLDNWDYDRNTPRWRLNYKWIDQNYGPGIRFSLGMHPYNVGQAAPPGVNGIAGAGPYYYKDYYNQSSGTFDTDYRVEVLINYKNAFGYSRANQDLDLEIVTKKSGGQYVLKHHWSVDSFMGDGTRFSDLILPDTTYLERWDERTGEGQEFSYRAAMFLRMPSYYTNGPTVDGQVLPRHLFDARSQRAIWTELGRYTEPGNVAPYKYLRGAGIAPTSFTGWDGSLENSLNWAAEPNQLYGGGAPVDEATAPSTIDAGSLNANRTSSKRYANDGEWLVYNWYHQRATGFGKEADVVGGASMGDNATDGYRYMKSHGYIWNTNCTPGYWRQKYVGVDPQTSEVYTATTGSMKPKGLVGWQMLTVYNKVLDTTPDVKLANGTNVANVHTKSDGTFYGMPVYRPTIQQTSSTYPLHLVTYKVNVHTQSRTASCPRLNEILGNSWIVIHPNNAASATGGPIQNGDRVRVITETSAGLGISFEGEAKVTSKARENVVSISHSQGHRDKDAGKENAAFGKYLVGVDTSGNDTANLSTISGWRINRYLSRSLNSAGGSNAYDDWSLDLPPSAPGKGIHPNQGAINRHTSDTVGGVAGELATDPVGASLAWYDSKCRIEKI